MSSLTNKEIGRLGENIAVGWLEKKGYKILERNFSFCDNFKKGELDIVAKKGETIIFFEVKATDSESFVFFPEDRVNFKKRKQLLKIGQEWLIKNKLSLDIPWQFDVISVRIDLERKKAFVRHFANSFC